MAEELPPVIAVALGSPAPGQDGTLDVHGRPWHFLAWGKISDPPLLLAHGVTSNARAWWRLGPALAAARRRVIAVDMPGHGRSAAWDGRYRFRDTAADLADFVAAAGWSLPSLIVVGHSWGAMVTAHLPQVGVRPATLVLVDPPWLTLAQLKALASDPFERHYDSFEEARAAVATSNPAWSAGDVIEKAHALTQFDPDCAEAVLLKNGTFDSGMSALRDPAAQGVPVWLIRGDWSAGGLIPDEALSAIGAQVGSDRVIRIAGAPHSPHRTRPEAVTLAILRAIGGIAPGRRAQSRSA